jgi:hypothetical protein
MNLTVRRSSAVHVVDAVNALSIPDRASTEKIGHREDDVFYRGGAIAPR